MLWRPRCDVLGSWTSVTSGVECVVVCWVSTTSYAGNYIDDAGAASVAAELHNVPALTFLDVSGAWSSAVVQSQLSVTRVWRCGVALWCGALVWRSGVALLLARFFLARTFVTGCLCARR